MGGVLEEQEDEAQRQVLMAFSAQALHSSIAASIEEATGRPMPQMEVRIKDLSIAADVAVIQSKDGSVADNQLPTIANIILMSLSKCSLKKHVVRKQILHPFSAVFEPGTITLVLGQPGSGKSSLMKMISGRFPMAKNVVVGGEIFLNDRSVREFKGRVPQFIAYVNQHDKHFPTLTVKETIKFAHAFCGGKLNKKDESFFKQGAAEKTQAALSLVRALFQYYPDIIIQQLGLQTCQDTVVGDAMLRGISGGQRKRVTTGEMQFGKKHVVIMDEISTGLDSASTFDIVSTQRSIAKNLKKTIIISLLQPSPEVFNLFDSVLILNDGEVIYHGPREQVTDYFLGLGFACPPRRDVADFLLDLGTDQQQQYQVAVTEGPRRNDRHPHQASEFSSLFRASSIHEDVLKKLNAPTDTNLVQVTKDYLADREQFYQTFGENLRVLLKRQMLLTVRNTAFLKGRVIMVFVMGLLYGSTFYQFDPLSVQVVLGMIFSAVMFLSMGQASQIEPFMNAREIFYKQRGANFYRTSAYVLSACASQIPSAIFESAVFGSIVYWMCGFVSRAGNFIVFEFILLLTNLTFAAWFLFIAAVAPNLTVAKPLSMVSVLVFVLFAGFIISKASLPSYTQWLYWINPMAWCLRALAVNQYRSAPLDVCEYNNVNYCTLVGMKTGEYYLHVFGLPSDQKWVALGVIYLVFTYLAFMALSFLVFEYKRYESSENHATVTNADEKDVAHVLSSRLSGNHDKTDVRPFGASTSAIVAPMPDQGTSKVTPVTLAFNDLWYTVPDPSNPRETIDLLQGVTGYATPGSMTALMGSSGAGKTTLMDVIAGRKTGGRIRGNILLNGYKATKLAIRRCTGYCEQMDIHSEAATIREALMFSAFMRQDRSVSAKQKIASVNECIQLLNLGPIADRIIRGSSTEQMKRLTIGVELAAQPSVLFMDEPTSGLDAQSAKVIMDSARKVANTGRTIICTIHQPSSEVFQCFDRLLLLKRGGETVYFGDLGSSCENLIKYFEAVPGIAKIPSGYNPATWMLECIGAGVSSSASGGGGASNNFVEIFKQSHEYHSLTTFMSLDGVSHPSSEVPELVFSREYAADAATQMRYVIKRFVDMYWRTPSYNLVRLGISAVLAIIFGIIFVGADYTSYHGINSGMGMIFVTTLFNGVVSLNSILPLAAEERASYYREKASQMYHPFWYFLGGMLVEIPYVFASTLVFTSIFFPFVGFQGFGNALQYWGNLGILVLLLTYLGQLLAYATPTVEVAATLGTMVISIQGLFMGFNPPASSIPSGYKWIYYLTPQRYILSNLGAIALGSCPSAGGSDIGCQELTGAPVRLGKLTVQQYLKLVFSMSHDDIVQHIGIIFAFMAGFQALSLLSLWFVNHQKR